MSDLRELAERVEKLAGPCRETDSRVFRAMGSPLPSSFAGLGISLTWQPDGSATMPIGDMQVRYDPPAFTASLDAVVALIERELPDWVWNAGACHVAFLAAGERPCSADIMDCGKAATPALALLAAFLRAKGGEHG